MALSATVPPIAAAASETSAASPHQRWSIMERPKQSRTAPTSSGPSHSSPRSSAAARTDAASSVRTSSGVKKLRLLKTTQSGFEGFIVDKYTTLQPVGSGAGSVSATRMFSTEMTGTWAFSAKPRGGYAAANSRIRELLVTQFAGDRPDGVFSKSLQETTYKMCTTVLDAYPSVENVCLVTPNIHFYRWEGEQFDLKNDNVVFQSTDPGTTASGRIVTTLSRKRSKL